MSRFKARRLLGQFLCLLVVLLTYLYFARLQSAETLPSTIAYFHESNLYTKTHKIGAVIHFDARFAQDEFDVNSLQNTLRDLIHSYSHFTHDIGLESWIAHGTLLGWYWNQHRLPWDTDVDVQISYHDISTLSQFNGTQFQYNSTTYVLDINPNYVNSFEDKANKIDGRWIDTENGAYIDITAVRTVKGQLACKDGHHYKIHDIYPLSRSHFEEAPIYVPHRPRKLIGQEYGWLALYKTHFHWYSFNSTSKLWEQD